MKIKHLATVAAISILSLGFINYAPNSTKAQADSPQIVQANPCAAKNPCASNPCAAKNPCAANPCAGKNPCAANPCAGKNPCAANPCAANPCAGKNPCASENPCAAKSNSAPKVYIESASNLAIRGTDPVAYFTQSKAVKGNSQYEYKWNGATWRFSSKENMALFAANPEQYAPQYGGYCAKGMSEGNAVSTDPDAWKIVDGKLYLNYSKGVQRQWLRDVPGNIALADGFYPKALIGATVFE